MTQEVGIAFSGGGSRAIAFHLGVLETLRNLKIDRKIKVVSAISGGAIVGALWALHSDDWKTFESKTSRILKEGLQWSIFRKTFGVKTLLKRWYGWGIDPDILAQVLDDKIFDGIKLSDIPENPLLILNTTDLKNGVNFKFSRNEMGSYKDKGFVPGTIRLSQAVAYSAAYPMFFLPKKLALSDTSEVFLTDGGSYDCIGANALMPDKDDSVSILKTDCETVLLSDASFPYIKNKKYIANSIVNGLYGSYLASSNRNRSLIYQKAWLHKNSGQIKHLGTIKMDSTHPDLLEGWEKKDLEYLSYYKTDFNPITGRALALLKERGNKAAEVVIKLHLKHLL